MDWFLYNNGLHYERVKGYRNIVKPISRPFDFTLNKTVLKNKKSSETSLPVSFSTWFLKKNVSFVIFY